MTRSKRGAARISAVWLISVGVLFLAALAFGFIAQGDLSAERGQRVNAEDAEAKADALLDGANDLKRNISQVLGWYDRASADPVTDVEAARSALEDLRATFLDLSATEADFETALPKIVAAYEARGTKTGELEQRVQSLTNDVQTAQSAQARIQADKDQVIADLRQQLADEQQNAAQRQSELEDRLSAAQDQVSERDAELRQSRSDLQTLARDFDSQKKVWKTRVAALSTVTKFATEPFNQYPDAKIVEVSNQLPLAWIDIGSDHRLARGIRFRVEAAVPSTGRVKAWAEVVRVEPRRAEVLLSDLADRFDPVVAGDVIINPLYDPVGGRNAVLVGRFSGAYAEAELVLLLDRMAINVQPALDLTTHFLIVGGELWKDPMTNEPLEEPIQPSDLAVYKNAEALGVQIIPLQDIREFFRFGGSSAGQ